MSPPKLGLYIKGQIARYPFLSGTNVPMAGGHLTFPRKPDGFELEIGRSFGLP